MVDIVTALSAASSGMEAQSMRLRHVSENIANADTPGYQRKVPVFRDTGEAVALGPVTLDRRPAERVFDPGHPLADENGYHEGSNVDLVIELADAREAQQGYEANLRVFDQARQMSQSLLDMIRR